MNKYHKQIEDAIKDRAIIYYYFFEEIEKKFGVGPAKQIFKKAVYRRGVDKGKKYKSVGACHPSTGSGQVGMPNFNKIADIFVNSSPADGNLFKPKKIKADKDTAVLTMSSCPLVTTWKELGLSKSRIKLMCDLAKEIDYGTFESNGLKLDFKSTIGAGDKCCKLELRKK